MQTLKKCIYISVIFTFNYNRNAEYIFNKQTNHKTIVMKAKDSFPRNIMWSSEKWQRMTHIIPAVNEKETKAF